MTNLKKENLNSLYLSNQNYFELVKQCDKSMNLTPEENQMLLTHAVPRFIAGIPYLSCESNPDLLACMNLNAYIGGFRNREFFATRPGETIQDRIEPYIHSVDGKQDIISLCKVVLEEVSLLDHNNDKEDDIKTGHSNPIVDGVIDFKKEKNRIEEKRRSYPEDIQILVDGSFDGKVLCKFWGPKRP